MSLYDITDEYQLTLSSLEGMELDQQTIDDTMAGIEGDFKAKAKNVAAYILNQDLLIKMCKDHEKVIIKRRKDKEKANEWLKEYLRQSMAKIGLSKIDGGVFGVSLSDKPSQVVDVTDQDKLNSSYILRTYSERVDKKLIAFDLKAGTKVEGACFIDGKRTLSIK